MRVVPLSEVSGPRSTAKGQNVKFEEYFGDQETSNDSVFASAVVKELKSTTNASYFEDEEEFLKKSPPQPQKKTFSSAALLAMGLDRKVKEIEKRTTEAKSRIELSMRKGPYNASTTAYVTGGHSSTLTAALLPNGMPAPKSPTAEENKWGPQMYQPDKLVEKEVPHLPRKMLRLLDRYVEELEWEAQREAEMEADMQSDIDYDNHVNRLSGAESLSPQKSLQQSLSRMLVRSLDPRNSRLSHETAVESQKSFERLPGRQAIASNVSMISGVTSVRPGSRVEEAPVGRDQAEMSDTLKAVLNDVVEAEIKEMEKENDLPLPPPKKVTSPRLLKASLSGVPETHKTLSLRYDMGAHGTLDVPLPVKHAMTTAPVEYPTLSDTKMDKGYPAKGSSVTASIVSKPTRRYRPRASSRGSQKSGNQTPLTQWDAGASPSPPLVHGGRVSVQSSFHFKDEPEPNPEAPKMPNHRRFVMKTTRSRVPRTHYVFKEIRKRIKSRATDYDHSHIPKKREKKSKFVSVRDNGPAPKPEAPAASIIDQYGGWGFDEEGEVRAGSTSPVKGRVSVLSSTTRPVTSGTVMTRPGTSVTAMGHESGLVPPLDLQALRPMQPSTAPAEMHDRSTGLDKREGGSGITRTYRVHTPKAPTPPVPYDELPSPSVHEFVDWLSKTPRPPPSGMQHSKGLGSYGLYELNVNDFKYMPKKKPGSGASTHRPSTTGVGSDRDRRPLTARAVTSRGVRGPKDEKLVIRKGGSKGQTVRLYPPDATVRTVGSVYWPWTDPDQEYRNEGSPLFQPIPGSLLQKAEPKPRPQTTFQEPSKFDLNVMDGMASGQFIVGEAEYSPRPPRTVYNIPHYARPHPSPHLRLDMERRDTWK